MDAMIQFTTPIRENTSQTFEYTFNDADGAAIDLTTYISTFVELKLQGQVYSTTAGSFVSKPAGTVQSPAILIPGIGEYMAQFYCVDSGGNKIFGEPVQFTACENVENASLNELLIV